jgi:glycerophosphoryl diester phosphodiesterase
MRPILVYFMIGFLSFSLGAEARTYCCAHRGDNKNAPENTVPAFELAVQKGAHQIELDVQRTSDGHLVLMHDGKVDRTTDGSGTLAEMTFAQVRALDAGSWFSDDFSGTPVPTLQEGLAVIPNTILCNVHLKGDAQLGADAANVIAAMQKIDHCFLACTLEQAEAAKKAAPDIMICNMSRQGFNRELYIEATIEAGADFIQLFHGNGVEGLRESVNKLHEHNIRVNWFGASEEAPIRILVEAGIDYILTDNLDLCLSIVNETPPFNGDETKREKK